MFSSAKTIISKVPSNDKEALKSDLMGLFEKKRCRNFVLYLDKVVVDDKATWGDLDLEKCPMSAVYKKFSLEENTIDFIGHALAMELDDGYLQKPAMATIKNI
jgi:Rab GDP dissociation inhibitor